ncbi:hypothetical protein [Altererythrobacter litoralis]|uniref:Uncharacterized protein n=1 Tax=Altererythrobacter litoralis TaxID=3113904 RepID=A0ABU7GGM1_9SPHN|nr:hypothetical protein [Erythrobacteraceae bacterium 1XM1-14]
MAVINRIVVNAGERVVIECISSSAPALITLGSDAKGPLTAFTQSSIYSSEDIGIRKSIHHLRRHNQTCGLGIETSLCAI